jgi:hypothetical protein
MSLFRPAFWAVVVICAGALTGCQSGTKDTADPPRASTASTPAATSLPPVSPSPTRDDCPSRAQIADALTSEGGLSGVAVSANVTCDGGWATAMIHPLGTDPARAVVRRTAGRVRLVTYGTDALCEDVAMRRAPSKIKKALGPYC